jgi:hypothetical protein
MDARFRTGCLLALVMAPSLTLAAPRPALPPPGNAAAEPVLRQCVTCHAGAAPMGGLDLTRREGALKGGTSGPALVPGRASASALYRMVAARKMPPGRPLPGAQVEAFRRWIDAGAEWPAGGLAAAAPPQRAGPDWWSLQPVRRVPVPRVRDPAARIRNPIDAFVLARLEKEGLRPAPEADRATLIRRATFDLTGLPPTPAESDAFLADRSPDAWEKVVDRLLASPQYGERWARHWLDVARFAESQGFERDKIRDHAWRYRDYVIAAFNSDKPYDRFVREQIAGDVAIADCGAQRAPGIADCPDRNPPNPQSRVPSGRRDPQFEEGIIATGFLVAGPWDEVGNTVSPSALLKARVREEELEDIISAVGQTFLGMTVNCARCHDHKFDPIPQAEYYRFKAALDGVRHGDRPIVTPEELEARTARIAPLQQRIEELEKQVAALERAGHEAALRARGADAGPPPAIELAESLRSLSDEQRRERDALLAEREQQRQALAAVPPLPQAYAANPRQPEPAFVLLRGDVESRGDPVTAGGLSAVRAPSPDFGLAADAPEGLRRRRLADWIADPQNPLAARVLVNRVWQYHFGRGLVATANDFGFNGDRPSHPELLDWLARGFARGESAWRLKPLHRLIMLSSTYRRSVRFDPAAAARDAENRLLWRCSPRRLEGEEVRDAMLSVSGQLNPARGGPGFRPFAVTINNSHFYTLTDPEGPEFNRRSIYRIQVNSARDPLLETLDCPDPSTKTPRRAVTTTPLQALSLMNNTFVLRQARHFARRLEQETTTDRPESQVALAYRLAFGRPPTAAEAERAAAVAREQGLESVCWALLNASEFMYLR